jgi:two-component system, chemotaxis family, protein-glutamate methylesterase/glutaminase
MAEAGEKVAACHPDSSARRDRIVIGGSAGSLETLRAIARQFPGDFPGTIFVVAHIGQSRSALPDLLERAGKLASSHPPEEEPIRPGHIYVAPPDRHLVIEDDKVCLSRGPREHFTRPAIDPLFRSAARAYGPRVIGVVLSGRGSDGATGLDAIRRAGGLAVVEDPSEAAFPEMPATAVFIAKPQFVVRAPKIPPFLLRLSDEIAEMPGLQEGAPAAMEMEKLAPPVAFSCPECGGALRPIRETGLLQYHCHIGHRIGAMELLESQTEGIEKGVNTAIRMLNEQAEFARQMIEGARNAPFDNGLVYWERALAQAEEQIEILRRFLEQHPVLRPASETPRGG